MGGKLNIRQIMWILHQKEKGELSINHIAKQNNITPRGIRRLAVKYRDAPLKDIRLEKPSIAKHLKISLLIKIMESIDNLSEYERKNFFIAIAMLFLGTLTILSYVYAGGGMIFILLAIITILLGLYMAARISNEDNIIKSTRTKSKK